MQVLNGDYGYVFPRKHFKVIIHAQQLVNGVKDGEYGRVDRKITFNK